MITTEKESKLCFGQIWQIDEAREAVGGLGTFSEELELKNINNIVAKFMQSEIWITPVKFQTRNVPYSLYAYQKDIKNRANWCLLYKIEMNPGQMFTYNFLGWVRIPLHKNQKLREEYNEKKNLWIKEEIGGSAEKRVRERQKVADMLSKDELFCQLTPSMKRFVLSKDQQLVLLERYITSGKTQRWNEMEMVRIINDARLLVQEEVMKLKLKNLDDELTKSNPKRLSESKGSSIPMPDELDKAKK